VRRIRSEALLAPCASLGRLDEPGLRLLKDAGLARYHHNLESSRTFFPHLCTTHTWDERLATLRAAQAAGLEVCSGGLFGAGETWEDRVDLALALRDLGVQQVPINFLNPIPGTPLENQPRLAADEGLRLIAIYRLLLPTATLRLCGGRPTTLGERQAEMFHAGANALMTGDYLTTAGLSPDADRALVANLGLTLDAPAGAPHTASR
jgi:biotin synthase